MFRVFFSELLGDPPMCIEVCFLDTLQNLVKMRLLMLYICCSDCEFFIHVRVSEHSSFKIGVNAQKYYALTRAMSDNKTRAFLGAA